MSVTMTPDELETQVKDAATPKPETLEDPNEEEEAAPKKKRKYYQPPLEAKLWFLEYVAIQKVRCKWDMQKTLRQARMLAPDVFNDVHKHALSLA